MLMDIPMMMDSIPNWHIDDLGTGVTATHKSWSDKWAARKMGHEGHSIDPTIYPDTKME
jgi:hypothetical protein